MGDATTQRKEPQVRWASAEGKQQQRYPLEQVHPKIVCYVIGSGHVTRCAATFLPPRSRLFPCNAWERQPQRSTARPALATSLVAAFNGSCKHATVRMPRTLMQQEATKEIPFWTRFTLLLLARSCVFEALPDSALCASPSQLPTALTFFCISKFLTRVRVPAK